MIKPKCSWARKKHRFLAMSRESLMMPGSNQPFEDTVTPLEDILPISNPEIKTNQPKKRWRLNLLKIREKIGSTPTRNKADQLLQSVWCQQTGGNINDIWTIYFIDHLLGSNGQTCTTLRLSPLKSKTFLKAEGDPTTNLTLDLVYSYLSICFARPVFE